MAKREKPDSKPRNAAPSPGQPAANVVDHEGSTTGAGAQAPAIDAPREQTSTAGAPETFAGAPETAGAAEGKQASSPGELLTLAFPLPAELPPFMLERAIVIVKARSARGRWRAGRKFTPDETPIPFADLSEQQIEALTGDAELVVSLRVTKPD